jgi:phosphoglycolate phosphatase
VGDLHRLIAFDLDGTLVDSRRDLAESANQLLEELGAATLSEDAIGRMVGGGAPLLVRRALAAAGAGDPPNALERFLEIYDTRLLNNTRAYDGIGDAVAAVRGRARLAVLTNKPARATEAILNGLALRELFDEVVGGDGPWPRKPDPAALVALMKRIGGAPSHTLLVGDSAIDHETAARASVRCCMAAYGFGFLTFPRERLTGDAWVVEDPTALVGVIEEFLAG